MNYSIFISAVSVLIAASAFVVAWLNYRISRKMPNENKLFEEKFRSYQCVIAALNTAAATYIECAHFYEGLTEHGHPLKKETEELNMELDEAYFLMEDTIHEQLLTLTDDILEPIDKYLELFDQEDFLEETAKAAKTDQFEEKLNALFDAVIDAMREDLALEKLDTGLKERIGGRYRSKSIVTIPQ